MRASTLWGSALLAAGLVAGVFVGADAAHADLVAPPSLPASPAPASPTASPTASPAGTAAPAAAPPTAAAGAEPAGASEDVVVARVGGAPITAAHLNKRIASTPVFQLRALGATPEAIRRAFLDQILVPELLAAKEAEARGLAARPEVAERLRGILRSALLAELRAEATETAVTDEDAKAYYQANSDKFIAPEKVALWRILLPTEADASAVLKELGAAPDPKRWAEIARERSLDKATGMRGGNLGFIEPDGSTAQRGSKVDTGLLRAAAKVADGQLVPEPVPEGKGFAVVWKRQTMRAVTRPFDLERSSIRQLLAQERVKGGVDELLATLRGGVREQHAEMVDGLAIDAQGELSRALRPGSLPRAKRAARPQPEPGPAGLR